MEPHRVSIVRQQQGTSSPLEDDVAIEEPLEMFVDYYDNGSANSTRLAITMRTPGNDFDLIAGLLFTEGIIESADDITDIQTCGEVVGQHNIHNAVRVNLSPECTFTPESSDRRFVMNSSCGICGKTSIEALQTQAESLEDHPLKVTQAILTTLPEKLRQKQNLFQSTGGLHASALFTSSGKLIELREDVGRHNALDKLIGSRIRYEVEPFNDSLLLLSGRVSFELVQKAAMARIPFIAAIGAPSSLAIDTAKHFGMTLVGFLKPKQFNIYCGHERIA